MRVITSALLAMILLILPGCGGGGGAYQSTIDTYSFTGIITYIYGNPSNGVSVGMPVTGTFSVDRSSVGNSSTNIPNITVYPQPSYTSVMITVGALTFNGSFPNYTVTVCDNVFERSTPVIIGDQFNWQSIDPTLGTNSPITTTIANFSLGDGTGLLFSGTSLPTNLSIDSFPQRNLSIANIAGAFTIGQPGEYAINWLIFASIDTLEPVTK